MLLYLRLLFVLNFLVLFTRQALAQDLDSANSAGRIKHQWEFTLNNGFVRPTISPISGPNKAYPITGRVYDAGLTYTYFIKPKIGISTTGKLGRYPITIGIPVTEYSGGIDSRQYYFWADYTSYAELTAKVSYRSFLTENFGVTAAAGLGYKFFGAAKMGKYFSAFGTNSMSLYELEISSSPKPFLQLNTAFLYKLKNADLLSLNLSYQYSLKNIYEGRYEIATISPGYSHGNVHLNGNQFNVGLGYVFSGSEKATRRLKDGNKISRKEAKRQYNREYYSNRAGNNNAVRVYGALIFDKNTSNDKHKIIHSTWIPNTGFGLDFSRDFRKNMFWEIGLNKHEYWTGFGINYPKIWQNVSWGNNFDAVQVNAGIGYYIRNKNLKPLMILTAGGAVGFGIDNSLNTHGNTFIDSRNLDGTVAFDLYSDEYNIKNVFPLVYAGIRKDMRIRGRLFLSPEFRYYQGLTKITMQDIRYSLEEIHPEYRNINIYQRGSYMLFSIGLKYDF